MEHTEPYARLLHQRTPRGCSRRKSPSIRGLAGAPGISKGPWKPPNAVSAPHVRCGSRPSKQAMPIPVLEASCLLFVRLAYDRQPAARRLGSRLRRLLLRHHRDLYHHRDLGAASCCHDHEGTPIDQPGGGFLRVCGIMLLLLRGAPWDFTRGAPTGRICGRSIA
jgi:hypothetical protein